MTKEQIKSILESVHSWPVEDQEELAELAREIEARRTGIYIMSDEERAAVREGLEQAERGEFLSDKEMDAAHDLSPVDRQALERSAEDVRLGRFATDADVERAFGRSRSK